MNASNVTVPPATGLGTADCLQGMFPCSNTISGNTFLVLAYGFLVAYGSKYIAEGAELTEPIDNPWLAAHVRITRASLRTLARSPPENAALRWPASSHA